MGAVGTLNNSVTMWRAKPAWGADSNSMPGFPQVEERQKSEQQATVTQREGDSLAASSRGELCIRRICTKDYRYPGLLVSQAYTPTYNLSLTCL